MAISQRKSLDILIAVGVLAVLAGGVAWFLLGSDSVVDDAQVQTQLAADKDQESAIDVEATRGESPQKLLEKARLALSADMIAEPRGQNALYFYSLATEADPENREIRDEFEQVVAAVSEQLREQISAKDFERAGSLAERLALADPAASVLGEYAEAVAQASESLIQQALDAARDGDASAAQAGLARAEELFGSNAQAAVASARQELATINASNAKAAETRRLAALAAQQDKARQAKTREAEQQVASANTADTSAPTAQKAAEPETSADASAAAFEEIREQLASGQLDGEGGAISLLARLESEYPNSEALREVRGATIAAIQVRAQRELAFEQLDAVQSSIEALKSIEGSAEISDELAASLQDARIRMESAKVISAKDLVLVEAVPPVYPRNALRKDKEGWVEVEFTVKKDGRTENIQVVNTNQGTIFNKATIQAVSQWQFEPRTFAGQLIDQRVATRVSFRLTGG